MFNRIIFYVKVLLLSPTLFFKKAFGHILLKVTSTPKGTVSINIGDHTLDTLLPSRNDWNKSMCLGYCDVEIAHNINKYLSEGGVFIDVGAGIGYFSAIASKIVGDSGEVYSFEPLTCNANAIKRMIESNPNSNIILNDFALSDENGIHNFYRVRYENHWESSMMIELIDKVDEVLEVGAKRLDTYLCQRNIDQVSLIKIDVDGYELYVLKGLSGFFERTTHKPPIICEITSSAYSKTTISLTEFHDYMRDYGYQAYNIFNPRIKVDIRLLNGIIDVVFIPVY